MTSEIERMGAASLSTKALIEELEDECNWLLAMGRVCFYINREA